MNNTIKLPANVEVCIKPRKVAVALLTICIVLITFVIIFSLLTGKTFSLLLFIVVGFLITQIRRLSNKTKITPILLDITCNESELIICMPNARLLSDGRYYNQRYIIDKSDINTIEFRSRGFVFLPVKHMKSQAYDNNQTIIEEHCSDNSPLGFVASNDSIAKLQEFLSQNSLAYTSAGTPAA